MTVETTRSDGVLCIERPGTEWLATGWDGGRSRADASHVLSVPTGWWADDIGAYVDERLESVGFGLRGDGPVLLTGVSLQHGRLARLDGVAVVATAGLSNPAALPMEPTGEHEQSPSRRPGTVNVVCVTDRALSPGAAANLVAVVAEAKAATLLDAAGVPGTSTDAVVVGWDPTGDPTTYSGSATPVGRAARACVREAIKASLASRYPERDPATAAREGEHAIRTERKASVERL